MGDTAGRSANAQYSLAGRNSGLLSAIDAAELMKVSGMNMEGLMQQSPESLAQWGATPGALRPGLVEKLGMMGGLAVAGYDGSDRHLPWHLPESGEHGLGITTVHNGDSNDLEAMAKSAKILDWPMRVIRGEFRWGQARTKATRPDARNPEKSHPLCFLVRGPVHDWPITTLGQCAVTYPIYTNEQLIEAFLRLSESGQLKADTVGHYDAGQKVFIAVKIGETRYVLGDDPHDLLLTGTLDHSGEGAIQLDIGVVRRFCDNTIKLAKLNARSVLSIAHKGSRDAVASKVDAGAVELLRAEQFFSEYEQRQAELAAIAIDLDTFEREIVPELVTPDSDASRAEAVAATKRTKLVSTFATSPTLANLGFDGRRAVQAVSEFGQWGTDVRTERGRFMSVWSEKGDALKRTRKAQMLVQEIGRKRTVK